MRYVSEVLEGGKPVSFGSMRRLTGGGVSLRSCDSDTGIEYQDADATCLGYSKELDIAVKHDRKTARLHDYIISAETRRAPDEDFSSTGYWRSISSYLDNPDDRIELVAVPDEVIKVFGVLGSVVRRMGTYDGRVRFCTLFDLLSDICRQTGSNLMTQDVLLIDSGGLHMRTAIELRHTAAADRFFMKMYMTG